MIKIGILSFTFYNQSAIIEMIEDYNFCKVIGVSYQEDIVMKDYTFPDINSNEDLVNEADIMVVVGAGSSQVKVLYQIIRKSKHIFLINENKFSPDETNDLIKLYEEANINFVISQPHRINPVFNVLEFNNQISFINITENGIHNENEILLYNRLLDKVDMLLMIVKSNIYRISACSSSDEFINIRMEFNNAVNANITINQLAEDNNSWVEILSPGENMKIDLIKNEVYRINKTRKGKIYNTKDFSSEMNGKSLLSKEFELFLKSVSSGRINQYNISDYHFANILAEEILKKISYVLV